MLHFSIPPWQICYNFLCQEQQFFLVHIFHIFTFLIWSLHLYVYLHRRIKHTQGKPGPLFHSFNWPRSIGNWSQTSTFQEGDRKMREKLINSNHEMRQIWKDLPTRPAGVGPLPAWAASSPRAAPRWSSAGTRSHTVPHRGATLHPQSRPLLAQAHHLTPGVRHGQPHLDIVLLQNLVLSPAKRSERNSTLL